MNISKNRGFTLIELMIVLAILAIVSVFSYRIYSENSLFHKDNIFKQKAAWILQSQAELIGGMSFKDIKETQNSPFSNELKDYMDLRNGKGSMTVESVSSDLKRISLKITWQGARQRDRNLSLTFYRYRQ